MTKPPRPDDLLRTINQMQGSLDSNDRALSTQHWENIPLVSPFLVFVPTPGSDPPAPQFFVDRMGCCHLRGMVGRTGNFVDWASFITLPVRARPQYIFRPVVTADGGWAHLAVMQNGQILLGPRTLSTNTWVSLDNIHFFVSVTGVSS